MCAVLLADASVAVAVTGVLMLLVVVVLVVLDMFGAVVAVWWCSTCTNVIPWEGFEPTTQGLHSCSAVLAAKRDGSKPTVVVRHTTVVVLFLGAGDRDDAGG